MELAKFNPNKMGLYMGRFACNLGDAYSDGWDILHAGDGRWLDMEWLHFATIEVGDSKETSPNFNQ